MISTARRIEHANAYLALGLLNEAADELEAIEGLDRLSPAVMSVRCDLYMMAKDWELRKPRGDSLPRVLRDRTGRFNQEGVFGLRLSPFRPLISDCL